MRATSAHKVVRISTRNGRGFCSICGRPALGAREGARYVLRHVTEAAQEKRALASKWNQPRRNR